MAVVANQAVAFDKSMLTDCPHLGDVLRPRLILDRGQRGQNRKAGRPILKQAILQGGGVSKAQRALLSNVFISSGRHYVVFDPK